MMKCPPTIFEIDCLYGGKPLILDILLPNREIIQQKIDETTNFDALINDIYNN